MGTAERQALHPFLLFVRVSAIGLSFILVLLGLTWVLAVPHGHPPVLSGVTTVAAVDNGDDQVLERLAALTPAPTPAGGGGGYAGDPPPVGRLSIPSLGIDAPVIPVATDSRGNMDVPKQAFNIGWYSPGPAPGYAGDTVMTGHLDWYGVPRAIFWNLSSLQTGATIATSQYGQTHHWVVDQVFSVDYNSSVPGLFATSGPPRLSLITCGGTWDYSRQTYNQRVIVNSHLVD